MAGRPRIDYHTYARVGTREGLTLHAMDAGVTAKDMPILGYFPTFVPKRWSILVGIRFSSVGHTEVFLTRMAEMHDDILLSGIFDKAMRRGGRCCGVGVIVHVCCCLSADPFV